MPGNASHVVGIVGGSGSGKTTLAQALLGALPVDDAVVLPLDAYYHDLCDLSPAARRRQNFDVPDAIDWALFETHLRALRTGAPIDQPTYDFANHTRQRATLLVEARPLVIADGLLLLCHARVRALVDTSVFLDVDDQTAVGRRVARDHRERGRRPDDIRAQFARDVRPMFEQHVRPTRRWASLTLSGTATVTHNVECVLRKLGRERLPNHDQV